jgi:hypothetical protein
LLETGPREFAGGARSRFYAASGSIQRSNFQGRAAERETGGRCDAFSAGDAPWSPRLFPLGIGEFPV